jgi:hypothetical protein
MMLKGKRLPATLYGMIGVFLMIALSWGTGQEGKTALQSLTAAQILEEAMVRAAREDQRDLVKQYRFKVLRVRDKLDGQGGLKERDEEVLENVLIEGFPYQRLIEKNGQALSEKERKEEGKRESKFREKIAQHEDPTGEEENDFYFNQNVVSRFDFGLEGVEELRGRSNYVLSYRPKEGKLPVERRIDRALNKAEGRIWVDQESYEISRVEFELKEKMKLWWGLIGSIQEVKGTMQREEVDSGVWFPTGFDLYLKGRIFFRSLHSRQQVRWSEFDRFSSSLTEVVESPLPDSF